LAFFIIIFARLGQKFENYNQLILFLNKASTNSSFDFQQKKSTDVRAGVYQGFPTLKFINASELGFWRR
jgi:hypothetical protein